MQAANSYLGELITDYNRRFSRPAENPHDAHRPRHPDEDVDEIFTPQEQRRITKNLTVNYKRGIYLIEDGMDRSTTKGKRREETS